MVEDQTPSEHQENGDDQVAEERAESQQTEELNPETTEERGDPELELRRLQDALLRTRAEMDNLHKRAEREVEKSRKFAVEALLKDLVPVIDTLDQGIEAAGDGGAEGLSLTRKLLLDTLKRYGLDVVDPSGEPFDPQWHEAMSMAPSEEHEADQVITVLQRGYRLHDRVVRPARVIVAR
jgi:molecular chaperone GrpE